MINLGVFTRISEILIKLLLHLKSLEIKPDSPDALVNLSVIYKDLGNLDQALTSILKSLEIKPDNPDALVNLV